MITKVTVKDFAASIGISENRLLEQLGNAGVTTIASSSDILSDVDKRKLLSFLRSSHGKSSNVDSLSDNITLKRRTLGTVNVGSDVRKGKKINVEIRKKKVYIKPQAILSSDVSKPDTVSPSVSTDKNSEVPIKSVNEAKSPDTSDNAKQDSVSKTASEKKNKGNEELNKSKENTDKKEKDLESKPGSKKVKQGDIKDKKEARFARMERDSNLKLSGFVSRTLKKHSFEKPVAPMVKEIKIPETITVGELAKKISVKNAVVIKMMMSMGVMATINQFIDQETASLIVEEMGHKAIMLKDNVIEDYLQMDQVHTEEVSRPPVVTIMGHVDHGKTSLLDYIRRTKVAQKEAGGITQHIGAYHVETDKGVITFFDTPGHAAFSAMRARGVSITDIVVLIVAADDGVKQQTIEAIQHAKSAEVPIIVAINKIDKPGVDPEKIITELSKHDVITEEWGGENIFVKISAKQGLGIDELLDAILLQADMMELSAVDKGPAKGIIIESRLDKGRGAISDILVQKGELTPGDIILAGMQYGKVRALIDENGNKVKTAGPSIPIEVLGLGGVCQVGDEVISVPCEKKAREIAIFRQSKYKDKKFASQKRVSLENLFDGSQRNETKKLNIVLKGDVQGSIEALVSAILKFSSDEVTVGFVASNVGSINESDVNLAVASNAIIIGFNVRADSAARKVINNEGLSLKYYSVIYDVIEDIKGALQGMMKPKYQENILGLAEVRNVFRTSKFGTIAGCMVVEGKIKRNHHIRLLRDNIVIHEGDLNSLRRFKEDVAEVGQDYECGMGIKNYNDIKEKDKIEVYERIEIKPSITEN